MTAIEELQQQIQAVLVRESFWRCKAGDYQRQCYMLLGLVVGFAALATCLVVVLIARAL